MKTGCYILYVPAMILSTLLYAYVFSSLWGWYMVGFCDLQPMSIKVAVGISILVDILITSHVAYVTMFAEKKLDFSYQVRHAVSRMFAIPLIFLFVG